MIIPNGRKENLKMKKNLKPLLFLIFLGLACPLYAQAAKVLTLKDGSVIKGEVLRLEDHVYTVETPNLGKVQIPEADILTIAAEQSPTQSPPFPVREPD